MGIFDIFKRNKQPQLPSPEQLRKEQEERKEIEYDLALSKVRFTPENLEDYQKRVGYALEIIETDEMDMGVLFIRTDVRTSMGEYNVSYKFLGGAKLKERLVKSGIEALVDVNYSHALRDYSQMKIYYGLPVARKEKITPYR